MPNIFLRQVPSDVNPNDIRLYDPTVPSVSGYSLTAQSGNYNYIGQQLLVTKSKLISADQGSYILTGSQVGINVGRSLTATSGLYSVSGNSVSILVNRLLSGSTGLYSTSGLQSTLLRSKVLTVISGEYSYSGIQVGINKNKVLSTLPGSYQYNGNSVDLIYTPTGILIPVFLISGESTEYLNEVEFNQLVTIATNIQLDLEKNRLVYIVNDKVGIFL